MLTPDTCQKNPEIEQSTRKNMLGKQRTKYVYFKKKNHNPVFFIQKIKWEISPQRNMKSRKKSSQEKKQQQQQQQQQQQKWRLKK